MARSPREIPSAKQDIRREFFQLVAEVEDSITIHVKGTEGILRRAAERDEVKRITPVQ